MMKRISMEMTINEKIDSVRKKMKEYNIHGLIIPNSDPHHNEYLTEHWQYCKWLSGFPGSAAIIVVTYDEVGLWTDSRYFLIAEAVLKKTGIKLFKLKLPGIPDHKEWLLKKFKKPACIGIYQGVTTFSEIRDLEKYFKNSPIKLRTDTDIISKIWKDRPGLPNNKIFIFKDKFAGRSRREKIKQVRKIMKEKQVEYHLISDLAEIAWLLNIRGSDIPSIPIAFSYILITANKLYLFIDPDKTDTDISKHLAKDSIFLCRYRDLNLKLKSIPKKSTILLDPETINNSIFKRCSRLHIREAPGIITPLKAIKNRIEIKHIRESLRKDGVAMVKFFTWFYKRLGKEKITELAIKNKLGEFRSQQELYQHEAFDAIVAYNEHAACGHYAPNEKSNSEIKKQGILLIDSGGAYLDGTTDTTRVIPLGRITKKHRTDYTLVLKGVISLSTVLFPKGTSGGRLDVLARTAMWKHGIQFLHGTGHGIGFYLTVHEKPQNFSNTSVAIEPGMITTVEPGIYRPGEYGIRIENMLLCIDDRKSKFGNFYKFETLTLTPIDTSLIDKKLLARAETAWINNYNKQAYRKLSPYLNKEECDWFKKNIKTI